MRKKKLIAKKVVFLRYHEINSRHNKPIGKFKNIHFSHTCSFFKILQCSCTNALRKQLQFMCDRHCSQITQVNRYVLVGEICLYDSF